MIQYQNQLLFTFISLLKSAICLRKIFAGIFYIIVEGWKYCVVIFTFIYIFTLVESQQHTAQPHQQITFQ